MIISASRRTDIPAFYAQWFINRTRAGYCVVPNPFSPRQVAQVALEPEQVETIVFWTRNPRPLFVCLEELDQRGYRYYFQYTLMNNPRVMDPKTPAAKAALDTFRKLSDRVGPARVVWRYDPIVFSSITDPEFHLRTYTTLARALRSYTFRSVVSIIDLYPKVDARLGQLKDRGVTLTPHERLPAGRLASLMRALASTAAENGMEITSCAETIDLAPYGIRPGKCIDDELIGRVFGIQVTGKKDPSQRKACGCVVSKDIGMYDTCPFGCLYCYATTSFDRARIHHREHRPDTPSLVSRRNGDSSRFPGLL